VTLDACQQQTVRVYANTSQLQSRNYVTATGGGCTQFNENGTFTIPNGNTINISIGGIPVTETFLELSESRLRVRQENGNEQTFTYTP
jgi:hypothetical protein